MSTYVQCSTDGAAPTTCEAATVTNGAHSYNAGPTPFDLKAHEVIITPYDALNVAGTPARYTWRVEPPDDTLHILGLSPVAYWPLDDDRSAGTDEMNDVGPSNLDGTYYNFAVTRQTALTSCENQPHPPFACTSLAAPAKGYSVYFGGVDDSADFHIDLPTGDQWTAEMWVKPAAVGLEQGIYEHEAQIWGTAANRFACMQFADDINTPAQVALNTTTFVVGQTYHVVCARFGTTVYLFVDGVLEDTATAVHDAHNNGDTQGKIGRTNNPSWWWKGYIDDVAIYDYALNGDDVWWNYQIGAIEDELYAVNPPAVTFDVAPPNAEVPLAQQAPGGVGLLEPDAVHQPDHRLAQLRHADRLLPARRAAGIAGDPRLVGQRPRRRVQERPGQRRDDGRLR